VDSFLKNRAHAELRVNFLRLYFCVPLHYKEHHSNRVTVGNTAKLGQPVNS